ncbi:unnamed protein product [Leuciscus chuanchicus]
MPLIDSKLTKDQAGFRPGRSCTGQLLNLTQHIEDGFECKLITGAAFIDLTAAYDTVQHRTMIRKLFGMTGDLNLCQIIKSLLNNRRFFENFQKIEPVLESALQEMTTYYNNNHLKPNPSKTQLCSFHLKNRDVKKELSISWDGYKLSNHPHPVYLGVTLDRTLSFKTHLQNTKAKINTRNNILAKLLNTCAQAGATPTIPKFGPTIPNYHGMYKDNASPVPLRPSPQDLAEPTPSAVTCARYWQNDI